MADVWKMPTEAQQAQAILVQNDLIEVMNRLIREGVDPRVVLAGTGSATADLLVSVFGPTAVVPWFSKQAEFVRDLQRGTH